MFRIAAAVAVVAGSACSQGGESWASQGVVLDCHSMTCPDAEQLGAAFDAFREAVPDFDAGADLTIEWHADGEAFAHHADDAGHVSNWSGYAPDGSHLVTTSFRTLAHELMHVHLWRTAGDGDRNHEDAPGPWTARDGALVDLVGGLYDDREIYVPSCTANR